MSNKTTKLVAPFAGRDRVFCLRIGEIGELETLCNAGIGAIYTRIATLQFRHADVRETIRLGLVGGGMIESEADFWVAQKVDSAPVNTFVQLAADIHRALFEGVEEAKKEAASDAPPKKRKRSRPATSRPTSRSA